MFASHTLGRSLAVRVPAPHEKRPNVPDVDRLTKGSSKSTQGVQAGGQNESLFGLGVRAREVIQGLLKKYRPRKKNPGVKTTRRVLEATKKTKPARVVPGRVLKLTDEEFQLLKRSRRKERNAKPINPAARSSRLLGSGACTTNRLSEIANTFPPFCCDPALLLYAVAMT